MKQLFFTFLLGSILFYGCNSDVDTNKKEMSEAPKEEVSEEEAPKEVSYSQNVNEYVLPNEYLIFSFETKKGKKLAIVVDKDEKYIKYRFGKKDKIELEYPKTNEDTWSKFDYYFYMRGGGPQNEGLEEARLRFTNKDADYEVYQDYYSVTDEITVGVKVTIGEKEVDIVGDVASRKGRLGDLDDYEQFRDK